MLRSTKNNGITEGFHRKMKLIAGEERVDLEILKIIEQGLEYYVVDY